MNIHTIDTGRFTMDYVRFGQGEAPLVILPGVSLQRVLPAAEAIARSYRPLA